MALLLAFVMLAGRLLLLLIQPGGPWSPWQHSTYAAVGQCGPNGCGLPGRVVSYSPHGVGVGWQQAYDQSQFSGAQVIGQPVLVNSVCGPNGCQVPSKVVSDDWRKADGDTGEWVKYVGGKPVSKWNEKTGSGCDVKPDGTWGEVWYTSWAKKPAETKKEVKAEPEQPIGQAGEKLPDFMVRGVSPDKLACSPVGGDCYFLNGKRFDLSSMEGGASTDPTLPDYSKRKHITISAKDPARQKAIYDEVKDNPAFKDCWVTAIDPGAWQLEGHKLAEDTSFQKAGEVVILQAPAGASGFGKVLEKEYAYSNSGALAQTFGRKMNSNYDPNKGSDPASGPGGDLPVIPLVLAVVIGAAMLLPKSSGEE